MSFVGTFLYPCIYMYPATSCSPPRSLPRFLDEANDTFKKLCEMAGDRSKIKTNHAWMGPKREGDTRAYTWLLVAKIWH